MAHRNRRSRGADYVPNAQQIVTISRLLNKLSGSTSNIRIAFDEIRRLFPRLRLDIVDDEELPKQEARAYPKRWRIKIRKGMNEGLLRGDVRARWSLAHELAHIFLQHPKPFHPRPRDKKDLKTLHELQANLFTATFLAPFEQAKQYKKADEIRDTFQISAGAAASRLEELKRDERLRRMAQERGLPPETFSIEAGSCPQLENQSAVVAFAISETRRDFASRSIHLEPLNSSLLGTALFVSAGSHLLLQAYLRMRQFHSYPSAEDRLA